MKNTKRWPSSEAELAAAVVEWLHQEQWDVYQEVQLLSGCAIADIVAVRHPVVWVIETKRSLSLSVIDQAVHWRRYAHIASAAVPRPAKNRTLAGERVCRVFGIGLLTVTPLSPWEHVSTVFEKINPRFNRRCGGRLREALRDEHKTFAAAGNSNGRRYSPWKATCERLAESVRRSPGMTLKEAIGGITTHYANEASARSSLSHWIRVGKVSGVRCERDGRHLRLYPTTIAPPGQKTVDPHTATCDATGVRSVVPQI